MSQFTESPLSQNTALKGEEDSIDIKQIIANIINNWLLFVISIVICLCLAILYARYSPEEWHVVSKILVQDEKNSPSSAIGGSLNSDISSLFNVKSSADNEVQILKSRSLITEVVKQMQLNVRTYINSGFKKIEIYNQSPFSTSIVYKADTLKNRYYDIIIIDKDTYEIRNSKDDIDIKVKFGERVILKQYDITLQKTNLFSPRGKYGISIESTDATIDGFMKGFTASLSDRQSTTIDLYIDYPQPEKGEAILNALMRQYLLSNLQNKVEIADSTMAFINKEIDIVFNGLNGTEKQFEQYKEENNIADITEQSKALVSSASDYYDKLSQQSIQLTIISSLEKLLNNPKNKQLIPTSLVINTPDQSFGQSINAYNELLISRDKAGLSYTEDNPIIQNYNQQIDNARTNLLQSLNTYKNGLSIAKEQLQKQNGNFTGQLKQIPSKQRIYLDFQRQQQLKQDLYLFLLQKREETAISKTSTISSSRIIDYAKSEFSPFKPKKAIIYLLGVLIGLIIPGVYLFIKELLNIRINSKSDIEKVTLAPIIGEISHNKENVNIVVTGNSRSLISEHFRSLRTNLQYVIDTSKSNVFLFTSSMSGEGKSFISLNLGNALALTGKKVVFMEMDLRKPKLSENMGLDNNNGFTNYIVSKETDYKKIIKHSPFTENCYLISSGPIPPNPSELLINDRVETLIKDLKRDFDYVIIDCAPVGLVSDALLLEKFADITFYVVRQNYTYKSQLNIVNDLRNNKKVKNLYLLINDIKPQEAGGYGGYGSGYGYGGYAEDEKKSKFSWLKKQ
jgi:tyrosine-protein kinase Etk/Wzc